MKTWSWAAFWLVGFIWGSSFLLIRVGVEEIPPSQLVLVRCAIAAIGLNIVLLLRGKRLPTDWPTIRALGLIGLGNSAIPFMLIATGEQTVPSSLASVYQATAALLTLIIAHFALADERMTTRKVIGIILGFTGIIILATRSPGSGKSFIDSLPGQISIIMGSVFYATFTVYSKKILHRQIEPIVIAAGTFISATLGSVILVILEPILGGRSFVAFSDLPTDALLAVLMLGFLNTFIAYLFFYFIIQSLGAFRATMVTYVVPPVGLFLGWLVLHEDIDFRLLLGAALIFTGIGVVNVKISELRRHKPTNIASPPVEASATSQAG